MSREAGSTGWEVRVSPGWRQAYPEACVGILALKNVANPREAAALDSRRAELEIELGERFGGWSRADLKALPVLQAYADYYGRFDKTYHLLLQLESIVAKRRSIAGPSALVTAMFMAELKNLLLTAGHDLEALRLPLEVDVSDGYERYVRLDGGEQQTKAGDMRIADGEGVISSILYGPDRRTRITPATRGVVYTVYGPPGIPADAVHAHLQDLRGFVGLFSVDAVTVAREVVAAS